jgi:uncharacterized protein (TIGR02466 family)
MYLEKLFPVTIANFKNPNHSEIQQSLIEECILIKNKIQKGGDDWDSRLYNTNGTFDLNQSEKFKLLNNWVYESVLEYSKTIGYSNTKIKCEQSWFNFYNKNDYQEKHEHYPFDISAVYYLSCSPDSGSIRFYTHEPQGVKENFIKENPYSWRSFIINPQPGQLLVFKSNLTHGVSQNKSNEPRISLAYNFKIL